MKKTLLVCDSCGAEVNPATGGWMRANFQDGRKTSKFADLCDACLRALPGREMARRGRPKQS